MTLRIRNQLCKASVTARVSVAIKKEKLIQILLLLRRCRVYKSEIPAYKTKYTLNSLKMEQIFI